MSDCGHTQSWAGIRAHTLTTRKKRPAVWEFDVQTDKGDSYESQNEAN